MPQRGQAVLVLAARGHLRCTAWAGCGVGPLSDLTRLAVVLGGGVKVVVVRSQSGLSQLLGLRQQRTEREQLSAQARAAGGGPLNYDRVEYREVLNQ